MDFINKLIKKTTQEVSLQVDFLKTRYQDYLRYQSRKHLHTWFLEPFKSTSKTWEIFGVDWTLDKDRGYSVPTLWVFESGDLTHFALNKDFKPRYGKLGVLDGKVYLSKKINISASDLLELRTWIEVHKQELLMFFEYDNRPSVRNILDINYKRPKRIPLGNKHISKKVTPHGDLNIWKNEWVNKPNEEEENDQG